jgi:carbonic anhydrase
MNLKLWTRRRWLGLVGLFSFASRLDAADDTKPTEKSKLPAVNNATEGLAALKVGNQRFADQKPIHAHQAANWRHHLIQGQQPFATILACSDSRVPPELVFDQGLGDLFVIRVAGNIIADDVIGSLAYALRHLKTPLIVVMGHEGCGAVTAAIEAIDGKGEEPRFIQELLGHITPALKTLDPGLKGDERINAGVVKNVYASMKLLEKVPGSREFLNNPQYRLVGAVYELGTGKVRFLD